MAYAILLKNHFEQKLKGEIEVMPHPGIPSIKGFRGCDNKNRTLWETKRKKHKERIEKIALLLSDPDRFEIFTEEEFNKLIDKRIKAFHLKKIPYREKDPEALNKIIGFMDDAFESDEEFLEWAEKDE